MKRTTSTACIGKEQRSKLSYQTWPGRGWLFVLLLLLFSGSVWARRCDGQFQHRLINRLLDRVLDGVLGQRHRLLFDALLRHLRLDPCFAVTAERQLLLGDGGSENRQAYIDRQLVESPSGLRRFDLLLHFLEAHR